MSGEAADAGPSRDGAPWRARLLRLGWVAAVVVAVATPLILRAALEGRAELALAQEAESAGDLEGQLVHLGRAARWRLPLATHDERAIASLLAVGEELEASGLDGRDDALRAYREARRALLATRSWDVPQRASFERANARIAAIMAAQEADFSSDLSGMGAQEAWHLAQLEVVPGPDPWRANLAALAFVAWAVAAVGFVVLAIDAQGRLRPRPAVRWGVATLLLLVGWMVLTRLA